MTPMLVQLYTLNPPRQWRAGFTGTGDAQKPFYFGCMDCDAPDPEIAGFLGTSPDFPGIVSMQTTPNAPFRKLAMFCQPCLHKRFGSIPAHEETQTS